MKFHQYSRLINCNFSQQDGVQSGQGGHGSLCSQLLNSSSTSIHIIYTIHSLEFCPKQHLSFIYMLLVILLAKAFYCTWQIREFLKCLLINRIFDKPILLVDLQTRLYIFWLWLYCLDCFVWSSFQKSAIKLIAFPNLMICNTKCAI